MKEKVLTKTCVFLDWQAGIHLFHSTSAHWKTVVIWDFHIAVVRLTEIYQNHIIKQS